MTEEMGGGAEWWCVVDGAAESAAEEWFGALTRLYIQAWPKSNHLYLQNQQCVIKTTIMRDLIYAKI